MSISYKTVAVTGSIACGKSSVCRFFKELGAHIESADEIVHRMLSPETVIGRQVIALIGQDIVVDHQINRSKVAEKVFNQPSLLHSLESLLHPEVMREIENQSLKAEASRSTPLFVAEIPLLFEVHWDSFFDFIITVDADEEICKKRFKAKCGGDEETYAKRQARLLPQKDKIEKADFVIYNNGSLTDMQNSVLKVYNEIKKTIRDVDERPEKLPTRI